MDKEKNKKDGLDIEQTKETAQEILVQEQSNLKAKIYIEDKEAFNMKVNKIKKLITSLNDEVKDLKIYLKIKI